MGLEQNNAQHYREIPDKYIDPAVDIDMTTYDYVVRPSAGVVSGPIIVTLPRVAEARGRFYSLVCRNADAVNTVTITDRDDSECWIADIVFNGKCDRALLYSDGLCWHPLGGSPGAWPGVLTTATPGTSEAPTTIAPTTASPSSAAPTTVASTTVAPSSAAPTTLAATTLAPTSLAATTLAPTTLAPTTLAATTLAGTTLAPTTL